MRLLVLTIFPWVGVIYLLLYSVVLLSLGGSDTKGPEVKPLGSGVDGCHCHPCTGKNFLAAAVTVLVNVEWAKVNSHNGSNLNFPTVRRKASQLLLFYLDRAISYLVHLSWENGKQMIQTFISNIGGLGGSPYPNNNTVSPQIPFPRLTEGSAC